MENNIIISNKIETLLQMDNLYVNPPIQLIAEHIIKNNEGHISMNGALAVDTGIFTGRSPNDKYFVEENSSKDNLWWGPVNRKVEETIFDALFDKVIDYYSSDNQNPTYVFEGYAGADDQHSLSVRVIAKKAWQYHFCRNMFINKDCKINDFSPEFTIINASDVINEDFKKHNMNSEVFVIFNMKKKIAIIGGTEYGGEMKKGIFSVLHYLLPLKGVLSMHCSANVDQNLEHTALFFGLSGTGKTTLSTDPNRPLIGDDEHGWSENGIFNFEGGCYAKTIRLDYKSEPDIYNAIKFGALLENIVYDEKTRLVDFDDSSKTENTRVSYPLSHIKNSLVSKGYKSIAGHPEKIIFLTCDAYGVLPPIAKLDIYQAMYHFISGYTAKVAGTERGITEPQATFSPCFGGPFLTLHPLKYAELLKQKIEKHKVEVFLVNTGWIGGSPSSGAKRISIQDTRQMISSILDGTINTSSYEKENFFGFNIPQSVNGVNSDILNPINSWDDRDKYINEAKRLAKLFVENFENYGKEVEYLTNSGPTI
ncbi:MAG: phosphoenolpyruvate carboxykinase (ATP) [Candidatus Marinimicrobia bacterium]|nr:phosphoenolpyruvate carboxykinase (ATP) [Candidatus Neomarinimicrobiota bacterium]|tara:strand:- start:19990 stop:21600 length:1611 start_codon:yes stop_codon:yes gene_type:complete